VGPAHEQNNKKTVECVQNTAMLRQVFFALSALALTLLPLHAQVAGQQVVITTRDGGPPQMMNRDQPVKSGTAVIRGRVVANDTGTAIRRAQVRLSGGDAGVKSALTDANGRYEFKDLPAGRVTLNVSKGGFVSMQYGQTRPFEPGRPIELSEGQRLDKVDIALPRGSVVSGRVVDEFGEPVTDAMVTAMRMSYANGRKRLVPAGRIGQTNDLGQFRIYGLPPGDYYISATYRDLASFALDIGAVSAGSGSGSMPSSGYAPTYFPGTASATDAQRVSVGVGQEMTGLDISLLPVKLAHVTGQAMSSDGRPLAGAMVMLMPASRDSGFFMPGGTTRTNASGQFTLNGVAPGDYSLQVRSTGPMMIDAGGGGMLFSMSTDGPGAAPRREPEFASVPLAVNGDDISGVVVTTTHGAKASGRVVFENGSRPDTTSQIRVMSPSADPDGGPTIGGGTGQVRDDGQFDLSGLVGSHLIRPASLPNGWILRSVHVNGVDITDTGYDFKPGEDVGGLEILLTQRTTEVDGTATNAQGQALKDYTVVVFSADETKWTLPMTRWTQSARPDQEGRFRIRNLPAGSYYAVAVDYVAQGEWNDPQWLTRMRDRAITFRVSESSATSLNLTLAGG
jgi:protocatechuate 3,4-dioxygenase beta subunit